MAPTRLVVVAALVAVCLGGTRASGSWCLDDSGQPVDWWVIMKLPNGYSYGYRDINSAETSPLYSHDGALNDVSSPLGATLSQIYSNRDGVAYVAYNDEKPDGGKSGTRAHAKGVLEFDGSSGFWLVHSVPKFPDLTMNTFGWGAASHEYGQSFLCISLGDASSVNSVADQLKIMHVWTYASNMPSGMASQVPQMQSLINDDKASADSNLLNLYSAKGTPFLSFAKSRAWNKDLYEDLVEPHYQDNFLWETWRRNPVLPTYCQPQYTYNSINVNDLKFGSGETYRYTQDHSKWGVRDSSDSSKAIFCVGGINRMESQRERGGGTVCALSVPLHRALRGIIVDTEGCDGTTTEAAAPTAGGGEGTAPSSS